MWPTLDRVRVDVDLDTPASRPHSAVVETGLYGGLEDPAGSSDDGLAAAIVPEWTVATQRYRIAQYATMNNSSLALLASYSRVYRLAQRIINQDIHHTKLSLHVIVSFVNYDMERSAEKGYVGPSVREHFHADRKITLWIMETVPQKRAHFSIGSVFVNRLPTLTDCM